MVVCESAYLGLSGSRPREDRPQDAERRIHRWHAITNGRGLCRTQTEIQTNQGTSGEGNAWDRSRNASRCRLWRYASDPELASVEPNRRARVHSMFKNSSFNSSCLTTYSVKKEQEITRTRQGSALGSRKLRGVYHRKKKAPKGVSSGLRRSG